MFKTFKEWLKEKGVDESAYAAKTAEEMAQLQKDYMEYVSQEMKKASEKGVSKEDLTEATKGLVKEEAIKGIITKDSQEYKDFETRIQEAEEKANMAIEGSGSNKSESFYDQVLKQLNEKAEEIAAIKGNDGKAVELVIKVPATQTTGNVTLPSATPASFTYQGIQGVVPASEMIPFVQNFTDNGNTNQVSLPWVDEVGQEGDAAFIGEGVVKPLFDIDYEIRYSNAKKVAGKVKVSEEAMTDIPFLASEIDRKLRQRHDLAKQDGILNGDGTGANLLGITPVAAAFAAGGLAAAIDNAQNYDVLVSTFNQILVTSDSNYIPNVVFVHPTDATLMKLTKNANGDYLMPPFATTSGEIVNNVRVVQNTKIPLGYFLMGDFGKSHVRDYVEFSVRIGYVNDDFEKNLVTLLGESRVHHYISENEKKAFVYDQFSVAKTALETV